MHDNLAAMHRAIAERLGNRTALRHKRDGLYHDVSWSTYRRQADHVAAALVAREMNPGDRIAILSENRVEWLMADIATLSAGAVDVPLHASLSPAQIKYQISHSQCRGIFVSDQAQADKVFEVLDDLIYLRFIVSFDPIEPPRDGPPCITWDGFAQTGRQADSSIHDEQRRREAERKRSDLATVIYTSGTTGNPKGVMLTHGNLLANTEAMIAVAQVGPDDVLLSWLPYSHVYARTVDHYLTMRTEGTVCLAESSDRLIDNLAQTQPTWMTGVPRFYEKVWSSVESLEVAERKSKLRECFGQRIKWLSSGGAPLPRHVGAGFLGAGLPLLEGYGLTETSPVISFNRLDAHRIGTVGKPIEGIELRIEKDGEILVRGPHVTSGYWRFPYATNVAFRDDWLCTGDLGEIDDDGFLTITGRKKDLIVTSNGKNIAPSNLEERITSDPLFDHAVVHGDGRPYLTALLVPDPQALDQLSGSFGRALRIEGDFITDPAARDEAARRLQTLSADCAGYERIGGFLLLAHELTIEGAELTPTLKVRRTRILERFAAEFDALYAEGSRASAEE